MCLLANDDPNSIDVGDEVLAICNGNLLIKGIVKSRPRRGNIDWIIIDDMTKKPVYVRDYIVIKLVNKVKRGSQNG